MEASTEADAVESALREALVARQRGDGQSKVRLAMLHVLRVLEE